MQYYYNRVPITILRDFGSAVEIQYNDMVLTVPRRKLQRMIERCGSRGSWFELSGDDIS